MMDMWEEHSMEISLFIVAMLLILLLVLYPPKNKDGNVVMPEEFNKIVEEIPKVMEGIILDK